MRYGAAMDWIDGEYVISDDKRRLNLEEVCRLLGDTYWAKGRPQSVIERSVANSICFGVYFQGTQVGFARAVTDGATFTWIADVIVSPDHRGKGLGKWLMKCVLEHPELQNGKQVLRTLDAHGLYEKFGFERMEFMLRKPPGEF